MLFDLHIIINLKEIYNDIHMEKTYNNYFLTSKIRKQIINCISRDVGINQYCFHLKDDLIFNRANLHYFSEEFKSIINNIEKQKNIQLSLKHIHKIFKHIKDKLNDLTWIVINYY
jgi:hypothetical protein